MKKTWVSAFGFIILMVTAVVWASPVPDTGQTKCDDVAGKVITCPSPGQAFYGQDANYSINPMSYTKLDGNGNDLPVSATSWEMVRDNVTGLIWEMKTNKDGIKNYNDPHDADNTYTWYDSNPTTNGGYAGKHGLFTDTEAFIKALNDAHYGGYSDWRMPTIKELAYIVNYSSYTGPTITTEYFPNTAASWYWSSTTWSDGGGHAWYVYFNVDDYAYTDLNKDNDYYARAVRGGQSGSFDSLDSGSIDDATAAAGSYTNNGDGTVTDTSTGLMWQQDGSTKKTWDQALAYCEGLNLGGHTDWRLPTIKEIRSLVDYNRMYPAINTTYFLNTAGGDYWSSTTYANNIYLAWSMNFFTGYGGGTGHKYGDNYVRAVRGGQSGSLDHSVLSVSPDSRAVAKDAGTTTFSVSNTGTGTMTWEASVTKGDSWLLITSGSSGINSGTINCSFTANTSTSARTAKIRITSSGATNNPMDMTVTQVRPPTACTATLDGNLSLHIPFLSYYNELLETRTYWADFVYEYNPTMILFKLANAGTITSPSFSCKASTLSDYLNIHIPDVLVPDGSSHIWVDLEYSPTLSVNGKAYWVVSKSGVVPN